MAHKLPPKRKPINKDREGLDENEEVVLDDQLRWSVVRHKTDAEKKAAAAREQQRRFEKKWVERNDLDGGDVDDIGANFSSGTSGQPGNLNRDISRVMANLHSLAPTLMRELPPDIFEPEVGPDMRVAHDLLRLDRARRISFGYVRPPPASLLAGEDGGVNVLPFRQRRPRPEPDELDKTVENLKNTMASLPRRHEAVGTECLPVEDNQFDQDWPRNRRVYDKKGKGKAVADYSGSKKRRGDGDPGPSRSLEALPRKRKRAAEWMLRQPADSAVHAALLHLPDDE